MMDSLCEKDYLTLQGIIPRLYQCRTRKDLKSIFLSHILPLLKAQSALYAWTDPDILSPQLIDCVNIPKKEIALIRQFINDDPRAGALLTHSHPVIARDIQIPREVNGKGIDPFRKGGNPVKKGYGYFSTSHSGVITLALRDSSLGAGIHRHLPCEKPWTLRDVRVLEHLRPHLLQTIRAIVLTEELGRHKTLVEILADSPTAIALVQKDMKIGFSNQTFRELFPDASGRLPEDLLLLLKTEQSRCEPPFQIGIPERKEPVFKLPQGDFELNLTPLKLKNIPNSDPWLMQLKPLRGTSSQIEMLMRKAGLTQREIEACNLIRQGINAREIAGRLFISPHTVRTHIKKIHQKLGVHSRAQLVAALNRY
ncbi:MAG: helix-turn-helix transcriptional regulator [Nitrospinaceae bacterium]